MPQYSAPAYTPGAVVTDTDITTEFQDIANAYNEIDATNFNTGSRFVPNACLDLPNSVCVVNLHRENIPFGSAFTVEQVCMIAPCAMTLKSVKFRARNATDTTERVDIYKNGTTMLSAPITIAADVTTYTGSVSVTAVSAGDVISLRAETDAGTENLDDIIATLCFQVNHMLTTLPS